MRVEVNAKGNRLLAGQASVTMTPLQGGMNGKGAKKTQTRIA
jgi:hypothetical protein